MTADEALEKLKSGNARYLNAEYNCGDVSPATRERTAREGQRPYAVVLCCSDSREIPEAIFCAGIGELFVIRVAGNVIAEHQLGSIHYAVSHLGCKLVLVLGHYGCGAVAAAVSGHTDGYIKYLTGEILSAAGEERDCDAVCRLNVLRAVGIIKEKLGADAVGGIYHLDSGKVDFL